MMLTHWLQRLDDRCPSLFNPWLTGCVSVWPQELVLVRAVSRSWTSCCGSWLVGCAGTAAGLSWCWSAVGIGCCIVVSWYPPGRCSAETKSDLERLSEVSS